MIKKGKNKIDGNIALIYLILYSAARIFVEHLRIDSVCDVFGIPVAIFVSAVIIIVSTAILVYRNRLKKKEL